MEIQLRGINRENCVENDAPRISEEDETYARTKLGDKIITGTTERNVLGFIWNSLEDHVIFELGLVILFAKLYDPLGFLSTTFTTIKVIFQKLCINCKWIFFCLMTEAWTEKAGFSLWRSIAILLIIFRILQRQKINLNLRLVALEILFLGNLRTYSLIPIISYIRNCCWYLVKYNERPLL